MKQFSLALRQISEEKGIEEDRVLETIEAAIAAAYKKDYGDKNQTVKANFEPSSGSLKVWQIKYVIGGVDDDGNVVGVILRKNEDGTTRLAPISPEEAEELEVKKKERKAELEALNKEQSVENESDESKENSKDVQVFKDEDDDELFIKYNPEKHVTLEEARLADLNLNVGDEFVIPLETHTEFGRIAAQTAKQVIIQRLREAERESVLSEFKAKEGDVLSSIVQRREGNVIYMDIGRTVGVIYPVEINPLDNYRIGGRFRVLVLRVEETTKGPVVLLSRSRPELVAKLFEFEVPEISAGSVEIKAIARETGSRTKIAVTSKQEGVDPIGSLVGQKGIRVQTVINELAGEKIDIIEWRDKPEEMIEKAMSPAKVLNVKIINKEAKYALVEVDDSQFSLAIGKRGQNVRLAAKLTGWRIDVRAPKGEIKHEQAETGLDELEGIVEGVEDRPGIGSTNSDKNEEKVDSIA